MRTLKVLFLTVLGSGLSPIAPGTIGSLVALVFYLLLLKNIPCFYNAVLFLIFLVVSIKLAGESVELFGEEDSSKIVVDEFLGMWLSFICLELNTWKVINGFIFFRFFDIYKPQFIRKIESIGGGLGIVGDDLLCGVVVNIILRIFF